MTSILQKQFAKSGAGEGANGWFDFERRDETNYIDAFMPSQAVTVLWRKPTTLLCCFKEGSQGNLGDYSQPERKLGEVEFEKRL
jgi:hypothetical protein